jgi:hypothetical protein
MKQQLLNAEVNIRPFVALANKTARMAWVVLNKGVNALPPQYLATA